MFKHHVPSHHFNPASLSRQLNLNSAPCFLQTTTSKVPLIDVVCTVSVPCLPEAPKQWQYPQSCDMLVPRLEDSAAYIPPMSDLQKKSLGQNKDFKQWASWEEAVLTALNSDILFLPKSDCKSKIYYSHGFNTLFLLLGYWAQEEKENLWAILWLRRIQLETTQVNSHRSTGPDGMHSQVLSKLEVVMAKQL